MKHIGSILALTMILVFASGMVGYAYAHERRHVEIGGKEVEFVVGWFVEPAYVDQPNKVSLRVLLEQQDEEIPVLGLEKSLKVEVLTGGRSVTLGLRPVFRDPGHYTADLMPTVAGTYVFRFFGNVNGTQINEVFDCSKGHFDCVQSISAIQFPEKSLSSRELPKTLSDINTKLSQIDGKVSSVADASKRAQSTADNVAMIAYGGLGTGIIGVVLAVVGLARRPR